MKKVEVKLKDYRYNILIGKNVFNLAAKEIKKEYAGKKILVVIDKNFFSFWHEKIKLYLPEDDSITYFILPPGEKSKSQKYVEKIYSILIKKQFGRDGIIIALGGGVTGDLAGYAAATYMRGINYIQIPTTLLASVDSSVGGKTGINFGKRKNIIGAFHQPKKVYIDTDFLNTLQFDEIVCGLGEVVKYSFLTNKNFYAYLINNFQSILTLNKKCIEKIIYESVLFKSKVVEKDEKETSGIRKILNLGHTFAHAFESELNFSIKHGTAVLAGLFSASFLSYNMQILSKNNYEEYLLLLSKFRYPEKLVNLSNRKIYNLMLNDKKNSEGKIKFILSAGFGKTITDVEVSQKIVFEALNQTKKFIAVNSP